MGTLHLAANYIDAMSAVADWGHLQIVYDDGAGNLLEIEVQAPLGDNWNEFGNFAFLQVRSHDGGTNGIEHTPNYADPNKYEIVALDTGERDADDIWDLLVSLNDWFDVHSPNFDYIEGQNSNSYAATLLWMVGIDISPYISAVYPDPMAVTPTAVTDGFPGWDRNVLTNEWGDELVFDIELVAV